MDTSTKCPRMLPLRIASKETGLSYDHLRKLCLEEQIVYIRAGKKFLVNMDKLSQYLNGVV